MTAEAERKRLLKRPRSRTAATTAHGAVLSPPGFVGGSGPEEVSIGGTGADGLPDCGALIDVPVSEAAGPVGSGSGGSGWAGGLSGRGVIVAWAFIGNGASAVSGGFRRFGTNRTSCTPARFAISIAVSSVS